LNLWIPDAPPARDPDHEAAVRAFLALGDPRSPLTPAMRGRPISLPSAPRCFDAKPAAISSVMGIYPEAFVARMKERGIPWFATATTVAEARRAEAAGADVIVAQVWKRGVTAAHSTRATPSAPGGTYSLVPAVRRCGNVYLWSQPAESQMDVVLQPRSHSARVPLQSARRFCDRRRRRSSSVADAIGKTRRRHAIDAGIQRSCGRSIASTYCAPQWRNTPHTGTLSRTRGLTAAMRATAAKEGDVQRMQGGPDNRARSRVPTCARHGTRMAGGSRADSLMPSSKYLTAAQVAAALGISRCRCEVHVSVAGAFVPIRIRATLAHRFIPQLTSTHCAGARRLGATRKWRRTEPGVGNARPGIRITLIRDGRLYYRGLDVVNLAEHATFEEVAHLLC
jgi:nitronate monooxygenase